jgi:hypothetical protein
MSQDRFKASDRLLEASPKPLGQRVPEPLHVRLLDLCDLVYASGETRRPTKAEILGAMILAAPEDPAALVAMLNAYGRADVGSALVGSRKGADVVRFERRLPGPRRGRST